jgi:hypothetical protein
VGAASEPVAEREREQQQLYGQPASTITDDRDGKSDGDPAGDCHSHGEDGHGHGIRLRAAGPKISHQLADVATVLATDVPANVATDVAAVVYIAAVVHVTAIVPVSKLD